MEGTEEVTKKRLCHVLFMLIMSICVEDVWNLLRSAGRYHYWASQMSRIYHRFPPQSIFKAQKKKNAEKSVSCTCFHWTECSRKTCITSWTAYIFIFPWHMENIWGWAYRRGLPWTTLQCDWWPSSDSESFFGPSPMFNLSQWKQLAGVCGPLCIPLLSW